MSGNGDSRVAIEELIRRYAYHVRRGRGDLCGALFWDNATYELREMDMANRHAQPRRRWLLEGRSEIETYIGRSTQTDIRICPLIHNIMIDLCEAEASSNCIMESRTWPTGHGTIGEYEDVYRRVGGEWRFQSRTYTIFQDGRDIEG